MRIAVVSIVFVVGLLAGLLPQLGSGTSRTGTQPVSSDSTVSQSPHAAEQPETVSVLDMVSAPEPHADVPTPETHTEIVASVEIPEAIRAKIEARASEQHPNDFSTQLYVIKTELKAYRELQNLSNPEGIPERVFRAVSQTAAEGQADSYSTQLYVIKNELKAYRELQNLSNPEDVPEGIFRAVAHTAAEGQADSYSTQLYVIKNQLKAYRELQNFERPSGIPATIFNRIARDAAQRYRNDFSTMLYVIKNELKSYQQLRSNTSH